jgi:hypothetical protein
MGYPTLPPSHRAHPAHPELPAARARCPHSGPMIRPRSPFRDPHLQWVRTTAQWGHKARMAPFHIAYSPGWLCPQFRESGHTGSLLRRAGAVEQGQNMWGCREKAACVVQGPCQPYMQQFIGSTASPLQRGDGERGAAQGVWRPFAQPPLPLGQALAPLQAGFSARAHALQRGDCNRVGAAPGHAARGRGGGAYAVQPARTRTASMLAARVGICGIEGWCLRVIADERRGRMQ